MREQYRGKVKLLGLFLLVFALFVMTAASGLIETDIRTHNGTSLYNFSFDRIGTFYNISEYGSDSYMDESPTNPNAALYICHPELKLGDYVDLVYATTNRRILSSTLNYLPWVTNVTTYTGVDSFNCTTLDFDFSAMRALYPGYTLPLLLPENSTVNYTDYTSTINNTYLLNRSDLLFSGSFDIGVGVVGPPKTYLFSVSSVFDELGVPMTRSSPFLLTSLLNLTNQTLEYTALAPGQTFNYDGELEGGEKVYVNDVLALELEIYNPCDPINQSGYYVMNFSLFDYNESCVVINRTNDVVLNFAGEVIDGDAQENGSFYNTTCSVTIANSQNVTLENFFVQNYYYGLCVQNSSVLLYGTGAIDNLHGAKIYANSTITIIDMDFTNNESEIIAFADGNVELIDVNFSTAHLYSTFHDATVRAVPVLPPLPHELGFASEIWHVDQFIEYEQNSPDGYAQISFYYTEPLANGVVTNNVSIFEYNGTYYEGNFTVFNGSANVTVYDATWSGGNWTPLFTLISPSEHLIIGPNLSNFSIFAPFGYSSESRGEEEPGDGDEAGTVPQPDPDPDPEAGSTSGGGGTPARTEFRDILEVGPLKPLVVELNLPENITLMQGEAGEIFFNLTNKGSGVPEILTIGPVDPAGWDSTNSTMYEVIPEETRKGSFMLAPYEKAKPGRYSIPVHVWLPTVNGEVTIVKEFMHVYVIPRGDLKRLRITEYPPEIIVPAYTEQDITFQAKNIGDAPLNAIEVRLGEEGSECLLDVLGQNKVKIGEERAVTYTFFFGEKNNCKENIRFYDGDELVGFVPLSFVVEDAFTTGEIVKLSIMIIFTLAWTALTIRIISRRRRKVA